MGFWRKLNGYVHMNCKQATEMYSRSVDDALPFREKVRFYIHYFACAPCRFYVAQLKWLDRAMTHYRSLSRDGKFQPVRVLPSDARERILSAVSNSERS